MKFHFEPNLNHQLAAVKSVAGVSGIFQGAPYVRPEDRIWQGDVSSNVLNLPVETWLENAKRIADENDIEAPASSESADFTIEMETGTGKTYVYLRTIFELNKRYGLHKFIIVVPSVAIREGALEQLESTKQHFSEMFGTIAEVIQYNSKNLPKVQSFCMSNHLSIMVMNKQAFDSDKKVINDEERDSGNLLEQLQQVRPIIIIDEPQEGMDTPNMQKRLAAFNPLFKLRYSATHKHPKNVINRLDPYDAYNQGLVKKISVLSIYETNTQSNVAIECRKIVLDKTGKKFPTAKVQVNTRLLNGDFKPKVITIKSHDDLEAKTNNPVYHGWIVENIGTTGIFDGDGYIKFTNGETIEEGAKQGSDKAAIFREQIRRSIQSHFRHKKRVAPLGIKPLALYFIDRVANYVNRDGIIRLIFEEEYAIEYKKFYKIEPDNISEVHGGYFAQDRKGDYTDNEKSMAGNKDIYDRILRQKSRLISFDDKLEFIFSHSALGVGWDNPNVFTICTLNESHSQTKKRQEIGRGLRLCVNQSGKRYRDAEDVTEGEEVNLLTIVPNESYHAFVTTYQDETREDLGINAKIPKPRDGNQNTNIVTRNEEHFNSAEFKDLWARIAKKTKCRVHFDEAVLIKNSIERLNSIVVSANNLQISLNHWNSFNDEGEVVGEHKGAQSTIDKGRMASVDTASQLARDTAISEMTAAHILSGMETEAKGQLAKNPMLFLSEASKRIRIVMSQEMVRMVKYEETGESYPMDLLEPEIPTYSDLAPTPRRGLYDHAICDSNIEMNFAKDLDAQNIVRVFVKLPATYKIPMPFGGTYNPDFALMVQKKNLDDEGDTKQFYFTIETKGASEFEKLKEEEKLKIQCAIRHFEAIGLKGYLAPVDNLQTFDAKAQERIGETFFSQ